MKILIAIKRTPQRDVRMGVSADGRLDGGDDLKYEVNPFDELAIEEALRIRENREAETVAVTLGGEDGRQQLLTALAMGIDRGIRIDTDDELDSLQVARSLAAVARRESADLILTGKLAVDDENGQIPSMLAALLDWPQATQASALEWLSDERVRVSCEVDSGIDRVELRLPAVITADLRLNEPRYASLPGIIKAKNKPIDVLPLADLGDPGKPRARVTEYRSLPAKEPGRVVESAEELVQALRDRKLI